MLSIDTYLQNEVQSKLWFIPFKQATSIFLSKIVIPIPINDLGELGLD